MHNVNVPQNHPLPSTPTLIKSTILAVFVAAIVVVTIVLPAEFGIDYTGVGTALGLTRMGEIKASLAAEAAKDHATASTKNTNRGGNAQLPAVEKQTILDSVTSVALVQEEKDLRSDTMTITLRPNEGKEIKLDMKTGDQVNYTWWSDSGKVNFDAHADSKTLQIKYHGYGKGSEQRSEGVLVAAFDGSHGWFWRNRTSKIANVTLHVKGLYSDIKEIK